MSQSFDFGAPDLFTSGAVGPPGQRVFYLQGREAGLTATLKCEKDQVRALGDYLASLLTRLRSADAPASVALELVEPLETAWTVASIGVGYDEERDRILIVASELVEEGTEDQAATARFRITREQAAAFVQRAQALVAAGRPVCQMCGRPKDPDGHVCPRGNGYFAGRR